MFILIKYLIIYLIIAGSFTVVFGLIVFDENEKLYTFILKSLAMPFIVIIGFIMAELEMRKVNKK